MDAKNELGDRISSIRIVSVDSYMRAPILGLDPCYSEFRGNDIKQVPVLRIFGTDSAGTKTCMHVHGVFPYLYVPYDGSDSATGGADRLSYQLAVSLDKAINISLGQTNSTAQHIFKVVVVKGIPFYGYHRQEHQYLKIFLYNPAMVRRTANLLQNGAILSRVYQPHESHLPYILQFMIDYNLYGMSFLYVPSTVIRYRVPQPAVADAAAAATAAIGENVIYDSPLQLDMDGRQRLDKKIERMTTSANEIDIEATFILNRFQIALHENAEHANPGIAFIWSDERGRRSKMRGKVPQLQSGSDASQDRKEMAVSESEAFHQTALDRKLNQIRLSVSQSTGDESFDTFNQSNADAQAARRKFNLNQFLQNSVYPAECASQFMKHSNRSMLNASYLIDHVRSVSESSQLRNSLIGATPNHLSLNSTQRSNMDADETMVDEELVLILSQKPSQLDRTFLNESLNQDEHNVLEILQQLEEADEEQQIDESCIEGDSILAPLTQAEKSTSQRQSQLVQNMQRDVAAEKKSFHDADLDSDDDLLNDFSMSMLECMPPDTTASQAVGLVKVPQLDGANDSSDSGEHFVSSYKVKPKTSRTPTRKDKYAPLNITITKSPGRKVVDLNANAFPRNTISNCNLDRGCDQETNETITNGCAFGSTEVTQSTVGKCETSPSKDELEVPVANLQSVCRPLSVKLVRCDDAGSFPEEPVTTPPRRYPKRNRGPPPMYKYEQSAAKVIRPRKTKPSESDYFDAWSNCIVAYRYDLEKNFFPEPGPSTINYYVGIDLPGYYTPIKSRKRVYSRSYKTTDASSSESEIPRTPTPKTKKRGRKPKTASKGLVNSPEQQPIVIENTPQNLESTTNETNVNDDDYDDIMMKSFYVDSPSFLHTPVVDSPLPKTNASSLPPSLTQTNEIADSLLAPVISKFMTCISRAPPTSPAPRDAAIDGSALTRIQATESAPSRMEVTKALVSNEFPQVVNKRPFYSNPKDINQSNRTEVGHTVLRLGGAAINDCEPFSSQLNIVGLNGWRKLIMSNVIYPINGKKQSIQQQSIEMSRELLSSDKVITIVPHELPPSFSETNKWIRTRNRIVRMQKSAPSTTNTANGNGYHVTEPETIVIDDDSDPDTVTMINGHGSSEKALSNGNTPSLLNSCNRNVKSEHVEDVICLDDSDDDSKIGNIYKISIISSQSTGTISLQDKIEKIAKEVGAVSTERNFL